MDAGVSCRKLLRALEAHDISPEAVQAVCITHAHTDHIAGLRVFLMLAKQSRAAGGRLALCSLAPEVKEVFDISGFTALFMLLPDRVSGLNALSD